MMLAPFDTVADMLRGTHGSVMDMYRQPEKLLETLEVITERSHRIGSRHGQHGAQPDCLRPDA